MIEFYEGFGNELNSDFFRAMREEWFHSDAASTAADFISTYCGF